MADRKNKKRKAVQTGGRKARPRRAPKLKIVKSRTAEQEEPIEAVGQEAKGRRPAGVEAVRKKEREQYRHGGIPIGSDPRE